MPRVDKFAVTLADDRLRHPRKIKLEVYDKDVASNDLAGTIFVEVPPQAAEYVRAAGRIKSLRIRFTPR